MNKKYLTPLVVLLTVPLVALGLALIGLPVKGLNTAGHASKDTTPAAVPTSRQVSYERTPANQVFQQTLKTLGKRWSETGIVSESAGLPHPYSCVSPAPSLSRAQMFQPNGTNVQVILAAYPAGIGATAFSALLNVDSCKPSMTYVSTIADNSTATESATRSISWDANRTQMTFLRYGDVIAFVVTDSSDSSITYAQELSRILERNLSGVCANPKSGQKDQFRNAVFSGKRFTGDIVQSEVKTEPVAEPELTEDMVARGVVATNIPAKMPQVPIVELPDSNVSYPLWPNLPAPVTAPDRPVKPKPHLLVAGVDIRIPDSVGPGCGWSFLQTIEPAYDEASVDAENEILLAAGQEKLDNDGARWQSEVLQYWEDVKTFRDYIAAYQVYAARVAEVKAAWDKIHAQWRQYYTAYSNWQRREDQRQALIAQQQAAATDFEEKNLACSNFGSEMLTWATWLTKYPSYNPLDETTWPPAYVNGTITGPTDEKRRYPKPPIDQPVPPVHKCPPNRPAILDQVIPEMAPQPTKPADPRPAKKKSTQTPTN